MQDKLIVIIGLDLEAIAFISPQPLILETNGLNQQETVVLNNFINFFKNNYPRLPVESHSNSTHFVDLQVVDKDGKDFIYGLESELKRLGFRAKIISKKIKPLLIFITEKFTFDQRKMVIGELINLSADIDNNTVAEIQKIYQDIIDSVQTGAKANNVSES
jgi:hypothetical protein